MDLRDVPGLRVPADPAFTGGWTVVLREKQDQAGARPAAPPVETEFAVVMPRPVAITVDGASDSGVMGRLHGFVIPPKPSSDITKKLVSALRPQAWRVWFQREATDVFPYKPKKFTLSTEAEYYYLACQKRWIEERCASANPANFLPTVLPWEDDYVLYREYIAGRARNASAITNPEIYLGWWNEPNYPNIGQWFGTNRQMFDTFRVFHDTVRAVNPGQKIEAPTTVNFDEPFLKEFLDYAADNNLRLDAVSWHEYSPDNIERNVRTMHRLFAENPRWCSQKCPEIHINEFNAIPHYFIPGWQAAYLINLENAGIDSAAGNSCFIISLPGGREINTCYDNWMGLFIERDGRRNEVPQPNYWVRRAYAEMHGMTKARVASSAERTVAMAARSDADKTFRILVSRYTCGKTGAWCGGSFFNPQEEKAPAVPVTAVIQNYPYAVAGTAVEAEIYRIPNENVPGPFTEEDVFRNRIVQAHTVAADGSVTLSTPSYQDGDVYYIKIAPGP